MLFIIQDTRVIKNLTILLYMCVPVQVAERSKGKNSENSDLEKINNVNSTPVHEKTGTRRNALSTDRIACLNCLTCAIPASHVVCRLVS